MEACSVYEYGKPRGGYVMTKTLKIEGMMCGHCEMTVKKALEKLEGVSSAEVSHEKGEAVVKLDADVDDAILRKAVEEKDYKVTGIIA
jgi:Cu2+-exporting ATPase